MSLSSPAMYFFPLPSTRSDPSRASAQALCEECDLYGTSVLPLHASRGRPATMLPLLIR